MQKIENILIIDDSSLDRIILKKNISNLEIIGQIIDFDNGIIALEYISRLFEVEHRLPNIIFLDINMPLLNGFEFLEIYTQLLRTYTKQSDIVMMSSLENQMLRKKAFRYSCVIGYLLKPISRQNLLHLCEKSDISILSSASA